MKTNLFRKNMLPLLGRGLGGGFLLLWGLGGGGVLLAQDPDPDLLVCAHRGYTLTEAAAASGASTYQWYENGNPVDGANQSTLSIQAGSKEPGVYKYMRMAGSELCEVPSNTFTVQVLKSETPLVTVSEAVVCAGTNVIFAVTSPDANATYAWTSEGGTEDGAASGAGNGTYTLTSPAAGTKQAHVAASFTYNIGGHATKTCVPTQSLVADAKVNPLPVVTPADVFTHCGSGTFPLSVTVMAGSTDVTSAATIKWYSDNGGSTQVAEGVNYSPTLTASDTYYVGAEYTDNGKLCASTLTPVAATINLYEGTIEGKED